MKKSSIILLLLSCTFFSVWAQKYEIALSEKEDFPGNTNSIQHIWTDSADNHYYSFIEVKDKLNFSGKPEEVVSTVLLK